MGTRVPRINADSPVCLITFTLFTPRAKLDRFKEVQLLSVRTRVPPEVLIVTWAVARRATSGVEVVHDQGIELRDDGTAWVDDA